MQILIMSDAGHSEQCMTWPHLWWSVNRDLNEHMLSRYHLKYL